MCPRFCQESSLRSAREVEFSLSLSSTLSVPGYVLSLPPMWEGPTVPMWAGLNGWWGDVRIESSGRTQQGLKDVETGGDLSYCISQDGWGERSDGVESALPLVPLSTLGPQALS